MGAQVAKNGAKDETAAENPPEAGAKANGQVSGGLGRGGNAFGHGGAAGDARPGRTMKTRPSDKDAWRARTQGLGGLNAMLLLHTHNAKRSNYYYF